MLKRFANLDLQFTVFNWSKVDYCWFSVVRGVASLKIKECICAIDECIQKENILYKQIRPR